MFSVTSIYLLFSIAIVFNSCTPTDPTLEEFQILRNMSIVAQCDDVFIKDWSCHWCDQTNVFTDIYVSPESRYNHFFYSAVKNGDTLVVAFRGSVLFNRDAVKFIVNWLQNLDMVMVHLPFTTAAKDVKVHRGILRSYQELQSMVIARVNDVLARNKDISKILMLGSSVGGALSTMATLDMFTNPEINDRFHEVYKNGGFLLTSNGCPRMGNRHFWDWAMAVFDHKYHYRAVNQRDIIVHLPPSLLGWKHLPFEFFFRNNTHEFVKCNGSGEDKHCSAGLDFAIDLDDHMQYFGIDVKTGYGDNC